MKAIINGIEVHGTPEEVATYLKLMDDMRRDGVHIKPPLGKAPDWLTKEKTCNDPLLYKPFAITGIDGKLTGQTKCFAAMNGGCYCTGACHT